MHFAHSVPEQGRSSLDLQPSLPSSCLLPIRLKCHLFQEALQILTLGLTPHPHCEPASFCHGMVVTALSFPPNPSKAPDWGLLGGKWLAWAMSQQSAFPLTELSLTAFLKRGKPSSSQVHGAGQVGNPLPFTPQQSLSLPSLEPTVTSPAPSSPSTDLTCPLLPQP